MPKRVFLHPKNDATAYARSAHHRAYVGNGAVHENGQPSETTVLEFWGGVARDVEESTYQRFKDAGIVDTSPPKLREDD